MNILKKTYRLKISQKFYKNNDDIVSLKSLKEALSESINGLNNLVYTYKIEEQENVSQSYSQCIQKVESMISEIDSILNK